MKSLIVCGIVLLSLTGLVAGLECPSGYYAHPSFTRCIQCDHPYKTCSWDATANDLNGEINSKLVGWGKSSNGISTSYCTGVFYYNKNTNQCQPVCKAECSSCMVDYDFCTSCYSGYIWNDYSCLPAVVGLSAATLAILVICLVFLIISCCLVIKAKK